MRKRFLALSALILMAASMIGAMGQNMKSGMLAMGNMKVTMVHMDAMTSSMNT